MLSEQAQVLKRLAWCTIFFRKTKVELNKTNIPCLLTHHGLGVSLSGRWGKSIVTAWLGLVLLCKQQTNCRFKSLPNDRNMPTQHIATLLGATCRVRLATVLRCVTTCWVLLAQVWKWSNLSQQHPTRRNKSQKGGQTHATCCARQCCNMLH